MLASGPIKPISAEEDNKEAITLSAPGVVMISTSRPSLSKYPLF